MSSRTGEWRKGEHELGKAVHDQSPKPVRLLHYLHDLSLLFAIIPNLQSLPPFPSCQIPLYPLDSLENLALSLFFTLSFRSSFPLL